MGWAAAAKADEIQISGDMEPCFWITVRVYIGAGWWKQPSEVQEVGVGAGMALGWTRAMETSTRAAEGMMRLMGLIIEVVRGTDEVVILNVEELTGDDVSLAEDLRDRLVNLVDKVLVRSFEVEVGVVLIDNDTVNVLMEEIIFAFEVVVLTKKAEGMIGTEDELDGSLTKDVEVK